MRETTLPHIKTSPFIENFEGMSPCHAIFPQAYKILVAFGSYFFVRILNISIKSPRIILYFKVGKLSFLVFSSFVKSLKPGVSHDIQSSAVIRRSNWSRYYIRHYNNSGRKWIRFENHNRQSHIPPSRASYVCQLWGFWGNLTVSWSGTALYYYVTLQALLWVPQFEYDCICVGLAVESPWKLSLSTGHTSLERYHVSYVAIS